MTHGAGGAVVQELHDPASALRQPSSRSGVARRERLVITRARTAARHDDESPSRGAVPGRTPLARALRRALPPSPQGAATSAEPANDLNLLHEAFSVHQGQALPRELRAALEPAVGQPLDDVRVHTDPEAGAAAEALDADAFAVGRHLVFAPGRYAPGTPQGDHLIAHEVAHAAQQDRGPGLATRLRLGPSGGALEQEAEALADSVVWGKAPAPSLSRAPAGTVSRQRRGQGPASPPAAADGNAQQGEHFDLPWRGSVRESYRHFLQGLSRDAAQIQRWIDHLVALPTHWQARDGSGQLVVLPIDEFERRVNATFRQPSWRGPRAIPVYGEAVAYLERETQRTVAQLRGLVRAEQQSERALDRAEQALSQLPQAAPGSGQGRRELGAAPSEVLGPTRVVAGGRGGYRMQIRMGAQDTSDNPLEDSRAFDRGTWTWEVFDGRSLARGGASPAASSPGTARPVAAETVTRGEAVPGGRAVTAADGQADRWRRAHDALGADTRRATSDVASGVRDGRYGDAVIGLTNLLLTPTSTVVSYGGYVLDRLVESVFSTNEERGIPFPSSGLFFVRCIARPQRLDGTPARPPSVAVLAVEVSQAQAMAREALDEPAAQLATLELAREQATDPAARAELDQRVTEARTIATGAPTAVIGVARDRLLAEGRRIAEQIATVTARPAQTPDERLARDNELRRLRERQEQLAEQLREVMTQLGLAQTRHGELGAGAFRPQAVIVDQESGDRLALLLEMSEPHADGSGQVCTVSDTTTARGRSYTGRGADRASAMWAAIEALAAGNDYGRGRLFVRIPDTVALAGPRARDFASAPGGTQLLRQRLSDLGTVATALAAITVPGAGEVAMLAGATTAAMNLATRLSNHTLRLDTESVNDVLNVLTAVAAGAQVVGRLRVDLSAVAGRVALVPVEEASALTRGAATVRRGIDRVQVITTTVATMQQFADLARQEEAGQISHARARELRARALLGQVAVTWSTAFGAMRADGRLPADPTAPAPAEAARPASSEAAPQAASSEGRADGEASSAPRPTPLPTSSASTAVTPAPGPGAAVVSSPRPTGPRPSAGPEATPTPAPGMRPASTPAPNHDDPGHRDALVPPPPSTETPATVARTTQPPDPAQPTPQHPNANDPAREVLVPPASGPTTLVPPPPANDLEAHQLARAQRVAPLIATLPQGTRIVPDATPGPLPPTWMRLSRFHEYLSMLGRLRTTAQGQDALYDMVNHGGIVTMNEGEGHYQNGRRINVDPSVHRGALGRAGVAAHESDHLRRPAPQPAAFSTEDAYVAAVMHHEALAQARLFEVRRAIAEASGTPVAPDGSTVREAGAREYYPAYDRARDAYLAAHPGDREGAHQAGMDAGVRAVEAIWPGVVVSIPGAGTYDQYARRNYRQAHPPPPPTAPPRIAPPRIGTPQATTPTVDPQSTTPTWVPPPPPTLPPRIPPPRIGTPTTPQEPTPTTGTPTQAPPTPPAEHDSGGRTTQPDGSGS